MTLQEMEGPVCVRTDQISVSLVICLLFGLLPTALFGPPLPGVYLYHRASCVFIFGPPPSPARPSISHLAELPLQVTNLPLFTGNKPVFVHCQATPWPTPLSSLDQFGTNTQNVSL